MAVPLFVQALIAVLVLPGVVAFGLPLFVVGPAGGSRVATWSGLIPVTLGTLVLAACVREFYVAGRGTLAPWSPPKHLVVSGPFRSSRNPMYVGVLLILAGWTITFASTPHLIYASAVLILFNLRVRLYEEPLMAQRFGQAWTHYASRVPRWIGSRGPGLQPRQARRP